MALVSCIRASSTVCALDRQMQTVRRRNVHVQAQVCAQAHDNAIRVGIQHTARRLWCSSRSDLVARAATGERTIEREDVSFDLGLGVVLAGLAFDSYLEPEKPPELVEETLNRTQIMYTSKSYVAANLKGLFRVAVRKATDLPARDANVFRVATGSDPYTVVTCGASSAKTDIIRNELNPVWDTVLYLFCWEGESMLKVNVFDDDLASADDRLGTAMINGEEYMDGHLHTLELQLVGDGGGGTLTVELQFLPLDTGDEEVAERIMEATTTSTRRKAPDSAPDVLREVALAMQGLTEGPDSPWQVLGRIVDQEAVTSEEPVAYIDNLDTDTQAWVYSNSDEKNLAIAFRGTEQVKWKDFITDLNLVPSDLNEERVNVRGFIPQGILDAVTGREDPKIHSGFLAAYDSIRPSLLRLVDTITGWDPDWTIYVTGHSLGGALATICAHQLGVRRPGIRGPRITMYNYGAPRVGNKEFASQYREVVPDSWRIRNKKDIVASVPRLMGYSHVPTAVVLDMSGQMNVTINGSDVFGEGKDGAQVVREMVREAVAKGLTQNFEEGMDVFEELLQHEMSLLDSLTDGSAVMQHMEDLYLKSLRSCVELMSDVTAEEVKLLKEVLGKKPL